MWMYRAHIEIFYSFAKVKKILCFGVTTITLIMWIQIEVNTKSKRLIKFKIKKSLNHSDMMVKLVKIIGKGFNRVIMGRNFKSGFNKVKSSYLPTVRG